MPASNSAKLWNPFGETLTMEKLHCFRPAIFILFTRSSSFSVHHCFRWQPTTRLHSATSQKAVIFILTAVRTWSLSHWFGFRSCRRLFVTVCSVPPLCTGTEPWSGRGLLPSPSTSFTSLPICHFAAENHSLPISSHHTNLSLEIRFESYRPVSVANPGLAVRSYGNVILLTPPHQQLHHNAKVSVVVVVVVVVVIQFFILTCWLNSYKSQLQSQHKKINIYIVQKSI
jgi:hypothetical protein